MAAAHPDEEEELEEIEAEDSAETIYKLRTNEKRKHTRTVNKIKLHMENHGSKRELRLLRNQLAEALDDCTTQHNRYIDRLGVTDSTSPATLKIRKWLLDLDKVTNFWFEAIEEHLALRKEEGRSASSASSSQTITSPAAAKLIEILKAKKEAETKLQQVHRENMLRKFEEQQLANLQHQTQLLRRQIESDREERQLADVLERHSLDENFERATNQLRTHSLPDTFEEAVVGDLFAPFAPTTQRERPTANNSQIDVENIIENNEDSNNNNQVLTNANPSDGRNVQPEIRGLLIPTLPSPEPHLTYLPSEDPSAAPPVLDEVANQYLARLPECIRTVPAIQRFASRISSVFPPDSPFRQPYWMQPPVELQPVSTVPTMFPQPIRMSDVGIRQAPETLNIVNTLQQGLDSPVNCLCKPDDENLAIGKSTSDQVQNPSAGDTGVESQNFIFPIQETIIDRDKRERNKPEKIKKSLLDYQPFPNPASKAFHPAVSHHTETGTRNKTPAARSFENKDPVGNQAAASANANVAKPNKKVDFPDNNGPACQHQEPKQPSKTFNMNTNNNQFEQSSEQKSKQDPFYPYSGWPQTNYSGCPDQQNRSSTPWIPAPGSHGPAQFPEFFSRYGPAQFDQQRSQSYDAESRPRSANIQQPPSTWQNFRPQSTNDSHCQRRQSPIDEWIQNINNPYWRDPAPRSTARPPKMTLKIFDGNPREWPSFIAGFKVLIHDTCRSDAERLFHLRNLLSQSVRDHIGESLLDPGLYHYAIQELHQKYGNPQIVSQACISKILALGPFKDDDFKALKLFSSTVRGVVATLAHGGYNDQLACHSTLHQLVSKLPRGLRREWGKRSWSFNPRLPNLGDFDQWLDGVYMEESSAQPIFLKDRQDPARRNQNNQSSFNTNDTDAEDEDNDDDNESLANYATTSQPACPVCAGDHRLYSCNRFKSMSVEKRAEVVKTKRCCFRCLNQGHRSSECARDKQCQRDGCKYRHNPLLHGAPMLYPKKDTEVPENSNPEAGTVGTCARTARCNKYTSLPVVPVTLHSNGRSVDTHALLDWGSQLTLIHNSISDQLELKGPKRKSIIGTYRGSDPAAVSRLVSFDITSMDGLVTFNVDEAQSVPELSISRRKIDWSRVKADWPHLSGVPTPQSGPADVKVLIGADQMDILDIVETKRDPMKRKNAPKAILTPLGWSIVGKLEIYEQTDHPQSNFISTATPLDDVPLEDMFKRFCNNDAFGTLPDVKKPVSADDRKAIKLLESGTKLSEGHYQCPLLWKFDTPGLPNNKEHALKLFYALLARFDRDPEYERDYDAVMDGHIAAGHARIVSQVEADATPPGRSFHLPHHGVRNPNKPGKLRQVFNASSKTKGVSLNDRLMKGPDVYTSMPGVVIRWRENLIALSADIEKMFYQVFVDPVDGPAFRFFWKKPGEPRQPQLFQMTVQIFGSVSSPAICTYALRRTATDNAATFPALVNKVTENFYADNYMDSFDTPAEAIEAGKGMRELLALGGFNLNQWAASNKEVLGAFPGELRSNPTLDLDLDDLPVERALGFLWDCRQDKIILKVSVESNGKTRRQLLSVLSSIYDLLGFLAAVLIPAKLILQDTYRSPGGWDDTLNDDILNRWVAWTSSLHHLESLAVPRCFKLTAEPPVSIQLHAFSDASEYAFGAVVYLRMEYANGNVDTAFVMAKSKVAPLKGLITIPRMELNGALIAHRLVNTIKGDIRLKIDSTCYWTDSTTVLRWLYSRTCRYHTYVANRVGEILNEAGPQEWRYVPTKSNPADDCSRGISPEGLTAEHRWFKGPQFLRGPSNNWPHFPDQCGLEPDETDDEVRSTGWVGLHVRVEPGPVSSVLDKYSSILRLNRIVAWIVRFTKAKRPKPEPIKTTSTEDVCLSVDEIKNGHFVILRIVQSEAFPEEIRDLRENRPIRLESRLSKLSPFVDQEGILRVGGRISQSSLVYSAKHPVILPADHHVTSLIIRQIHLIHYHSSTERTLAEARSQYWILRGRHTIRRVVNDCPQCRRSNKQPVPPLMAALPACRVQAFSPAFTNTGVDMFGPIPVTILRRSVKRYGILFTCLSSRAVHIEMVFSMEMDSFVQSFRRFVARRGMPAHCYSDNGTNLTAADKEINDGIRRWNKVELVDKMTAIGVQWHFNPPAAPHFGGAWERLIKSAKVAMRAVLNERSVSDEVLLTALTEIESLLNSRPLTYISVNPEDPEPLTPNHLLMGRPNPNIPPDVFTDNDFCSKKRWRVAQAIANDFWRRWQKEYIPNLTERRKWLAKGRNLAVNDVVIVVDPNSPRAHWPIGRVTAVYPGADGIIRSAKVKTSLNELVRPVTKICLLEEDDDVSLAGNRAGDVPNESRPATLQDPDSNKSPKVKRSVRFAPC